MRKKDIEVQAQVRRNDDVINQIKESNELLLNKFKEAYQKEVKQSKQKHHDEITSMKDNYERRIQTIFLEHTNKTNLLNYEISEKNASINQLNNQLEKLQSNSVEEIY